MAEEVDTEQKKSGSSWRRILAMLGFAGIVGFFGSRMFRSTEDATLPPEAEPEVVVPAVPSEPPPMVETGWKMLPEPEAELLPPSALMANVPAASSLLFKEETGTSSTAAEPDILSYEDFLRGITERDDYNKNVVSLNPEKIKEETERGSSEDRVGRLIVRRILKDLATFLAYNEIAAENNMTLEKVEHPVPNDSLMDFITARNQRITEINSALKERLKTDPTLRGLITDADRDGYSEEHGVSSDLVMKVWNAAAPDVLRKTYEVKREEIKEIQRKEEIRNMPIAERIELGPAADAQGEMTLGYRLAEGEALGSRRWHGLVKDALTAVVESGGERDHYIRSFVRVLVVSDADVRQYLEEGTGPLKEEVKRMKMTETDTRRSFDGFSGRSFRVLGRENHRSVIVHEDLFEEFSAGMDKTLENLGR